MVTARRPLVSEEEFLAMPETLDKVELLDGEVLVSPAPTAGHQWLQAFILTELTLWSRAQTRRCTVLGAPADVRLEKGRILQPDVFVLASDATLPPKGPLDIVPVLCVEVRSTGPYDVVTKRVLYANAGVREYWVVERNGLVLQWTGAGLRTGVEVSTTLTSQALPGFTLDVAAMMAELAARSA